MTVKDNKLKTRLKKKKRQHLINIMFSSPYMPVIHKAKSLAQGNSSTVRNNEESTPNMHVHEGGEPGMCAQTMIICSWML